MLLPDILRLERPLIGLDTETTGTNPATARLVELALEIMRPGGEVTEYRTLINPGIPIPPGATAVHHITDRQVRACRVCEGDPDDTQGNFCTCPDFKPWPKFSDLADRLLKGFTGVDFAGYNVRFDLRMIFAEFVRVKRVWDYEDARVIDAFRLWQVADPRSLEDAADRFLTKDEKAALASEAHTAIGDVRWSMRVIAAQLKLFQKLPRDVQQLHDLCSPGWFDAEGKLQWRDGELCIAFGQHRDTPLRKVPRSYLDWMTKGTFSNKVKDTCRDACRGIYPVAPANAPEAE